MTPTEANALASTAHQPELTPLCERCGEPMSRHYSGTQNKAYHWRCKPCAAAPVCECGERKTKLRAGRGHGTYWGCRPCRNRKSLASYNARKALGVSSGVVAAVEALVERTKASEAPPEPEKPPLPCWREHRDYWSAWKHLTQKSVTKQQLWMQ